MLIQRRGSPVLVYWWIRVEATCTRRGAATGRACAGFATTQYARPERAGHCKRALFVIDGSGIIRWSHVSPQGVNPGADGVWRALEALDAKEHSHA